MAHKTSSSVDGSSELRCNGCERPTGRPRNVSQSARKTRPLHLDQARRLKE